ncbi:MAG: heparinase II/III family protein [Lentisphaerae bacterium]|nr:heparinase II/III family protein [Lentisphaerota bacterium]
MSVTEKAKRLMRKVNFERPELEGVRNAGDPAKAFVEHVAKPPRPHFRFEYERKAAMLDFLREHYEAWRDFDITAADQFAKMPLAKATAPNSRATINIPCLGKAWWATGDPRYGAAFERFFLETETGKMFNWLAFNGSQAAFDLTAFLLLLDCPGLSAEGRIAFLDHLHAICDDAWDNHTSRWDRLMLGPEGHNFYLHGALGLVHAGLLFPEFKRADFFTRSALGVFEEYARGHLKADGGARETCLGYQHGCIFNLWDAYLMARRNNYPVSANMAERLLKATHFLLRLMTPSGGIPDFGDSGKHSPGALTGLAAIAAAITGDGECKWFAEYCRKQIRNGRAETDGRIPEGAFWMVGLEGARTYERARARNPNHRSALMGPSGYMAMRDSAAPDANYMAVAAADRGPIVTSHNANDIFSLEIHALGARFIGDMGYTEGNSPGRQYDKKTEAHACLAIEGLEQVPILNEWRWAGRVYPCVRRWISDDTHDFFHGVHEGFYQYDQHQILHARKIFFLKSLALPAAKPSVGYWVVMDWVESNVENDYRIYFHGCAPAVTSGKNIILGNADAARLAIMPPAEDDIALRRVNSEGYAAYIREQQLTAEGHPGFVYGKRSMSDCFVWVIAPLPAGEALPAVRRLPVLVNGQEQPCHGATAVELRFPDHKDALCVSHKDFDAELKVDGCSTWGNIAFRRTDSRGSVALRLSHTMADGVCGR